MESFSFFELLQKEGTCCISGKPLCDSDLNLVILDYEPAWEFPKAGNVLCPHAPYRAIAYVHDDFMQPGRQYILAGQVKFAVELRGEKIIYHPVETLKQIRYTEEE